MWKAVESDGSFGGLDDKTDIFLDCAILEI